MICQCLFRQDTVFPEVLDHQAHGLEKLETLRMTQKIFNYARIFSALRGWHFSISFPLCAEIISSWVKQLSWLWRAKYWSRTCANIYKPLPTKACSSTVTRIPIPGIRQDTGRVAIQARTVPISMSSTPPI